MVTSHEILVAVFALRNELCLTNIIGINMRAFVQIRKNTSMQFYKDFLMYEIRKIRIET